MEPDRTAKSSGQPNGIQEKSAGKPPRPAIVEEDLSPDRL
jgi:hypothetical protein